MSTALGTTGPEHVIHLWASFWLPSPGAEGHIPISSLPGESIEASHRSNFGDECKVLRVELTDSMFTLIPRS